MYSDAEEKLRTAMTTLLGPGPLSKRLIDAWGDEILLLDESDFPPDCRADFIAAKDAITRADPGSTAQSPLEATVATMDDHELWLAAESVLDLYAAVYKST